jgi:hypothetical protein
MISGHQQSQNKSECLSNRFSRSRVRIPRRAPSRSRQRRRHDSKWNCVSRRSSTRQGKNRSSKNEKGQKKSEKKKRRSQKRFDNSKCSVKHKKLKKQQKKRQLPQLSVRPRPRCRRDRKFLQSITHQLQVWRRVRGTATSWAPKAQ